MKLNARALALTVGLVWGGAVLLVGVVNMFNPDYGVALLSLAASVYPGYEPMTGVGSVVIGTLYALVDGAIAGFIFAWLYNRLSR